MGKRGRTKSPPFLMVPRYLYRCKAWRSLDGNARSIFLELVDRFNGQNNGAIALSNRDAGALFDMGKDTGRRGLDMLLDRGFIAVTSNSTFNQKRLAREWRLAHLPDDRTGHKASKDFMHWAPKIQNIGAPARRIGAQVRRETTKNPENDVHRRVGAPVMANPLVSQAHRCDTYRSTIPPVSVEAPTIAPPTARRRGARPAELDDDQRALLRWMQGFNGKASHRKAQQNLSGVITGQSITTAAQAMAALGMISIEHAGRSCIYALLPSGRSYSVEDPNQLDLEQWLNSEEA